MENLARWIGSVAPRIKTPLSLAALMLLVLYALIAQLLKLQVFSSMSGELTFELLSRTLDVLLYLGMTCIVLGCACYILTIISTRKAQKRMRSKVELIDLNIESDR